jgi:hypothetical protein
MDGSTLTSAQPSIASVPTFNPGSYRVTFVLGGSQRGDTNTVTAAFGANAEPITLPSNAPATTFLRNWSIAAPAKLTFTLNSPVDYVGLVLLSAEVARC